MKVASGIVSPAEHQEEAPSPRSADGYSSILSRVTIIDSPTLTDILSKDTMCCGSGTAIRLVEAVRRTGVLFAECCARAAETGRLSIARVWSEGGEARHTTWPEWRRA